MIEGKEVKINTKQTNKQTNGETVLLKDPSSVLSVSVGQLTRACKSCSRGSGALFWLPQALQTHRHTYP